MRRTLTQQQFEVFEVSKAGDLRRTSVTLANVLRDFGVHARDVLSLGLQVIIHYYVFFLEMHHQPSGGKYRSWGLILDPEGLPPTLFASL